MSIQDFSEKHPAIGTSIITPENDTMDSHGNMIDEGFDGQPVEIDSDPAGFWARTDRFLVAGPFPSHNNARFWLADPEFRRNHQTDRFGIPLWCIRAS